MTNGYVAASNENFGDPCPNRKKNLTIYLRNQRRVVIDEGQIYGIMPQASQMPPSLLSLQALQSLPPLSSLQPLSSLHSLSDLADGVVMYKVFYHIFANAGPVIFEIFEEQVQELLQCSIFDKLDSINCCLTGSDLTNYHAIADRINELSQQTAGKFRICKMLFDDTSAEKFTYNAIKADSSVINAVDSITGNSVDHTIDKQDCFILYMHTKGVSQNDPQIADWRRCLQYFLIKKADHTLATVVSKKLDSAGCMLHYVPGTLQPIFYAGNFWWARCSLLKRLFANHQLGKSEGAACKRWDFGSDYYACENFLFKEPHSHINLFPYPANYDAYKHRLPPARYVLEWLWVLL